MKKILSVLALLILLSGIMSVKALTYEEAINNQKPCAILVYATWADDLQQVMQVYNNLANAYGKRYNFVKINICSEEAKVFNKTNHIFNNVPYIVLFKNNGRMTRQIAKECVLNGSCAKDRLDVFAN